MTPSEDPRDNVSTPESPQDETAAAATAPRENAAEEPTVPGGVVAAEDTGSPEGTAAVLTQQLAAVADDVGADDVGADDAVADGVGAEERVAAPAVVGRLVQTVGRRKQAIVRVRLVSGTGRFTLNGKSLEQYFPNKVHQQLVRDPLVTAGHTESYDIIGTLSGGGTSGQAGALRLAVARALIELDPDDRPALKKAGFLTRDPRVKERKKYGLKKARKAPQYSKR
jgi:small subunit ribosomal protein S9